MSLWFNYAATVKILVFGLLVGAALPALFAVGMRVNAAGHAIIASADGAKAATATRKKPLLIALSWVIFALVLIVAVVGVLFIARDFIAVHTGWYILGAERP